MPRRVRKFAPQVLKAFVKIRRNPLLRFLSMIQEMRLKPIKILVLMILTNERLKNQYRKINENVYFRVSSLLKSYKYKKKMYFCCEEITEFWSSQLYEGGHFCCILSNSWLLSAQPIILHKLNRYNLTPFSIREFYSDFCLHYWVYAIS